MEHHSRNMQSRGFTLVEMLMVISVTGVLGIALTTLIVNFYQANGFLFQQTSAIDNARRGLHVSFQNLRQATYGEDGSYPIQTAATSSVLFYSDVDNDGSVEKIQLYLLNEAFYRSVTEATGTPLAYTAATTTTLIASYVRNATTSPIFRYYDSDGILISSSTVPVADIASVSTSLQIDLNPQRAPDILMLEETATLRNLRL